jgi:hypothetical protein
MNVTIVAMVSIGLIPKVTRPRPSGRNRIGSSCGPVMVVASGALVVVAAAVVLVALSRVVVGAAVVVVAGPVVVVRTVPSPPHAATRSVAVSSAAVRLMILPGLRPRLSESPQLKPRRGDDQGGGPS